MFSLEGTNLAQGDLLHVSLNYHDEVINRMNSLYAVVMRFIFIMNQLYIVLMWIAYFVNLDCLIFISNFTLQVRIIYFS